jgi:hypothetical protein
MSSSVMSGRSSSKNPGAAFTSLRAAPETVIRNSSALCHSLPTARRCVLATVAPRPTSAAGYRGCFRARRQQRARGRREGTGGRGGGAAGHTESGAGTAQSACSAPPLGPPWCGAAGRRPAPSRNWSRGPAGRRRQQRPAAALALRQRRLGRVARASRTRFPAPPRYGSPIPLWASPP